MIKNIIFDLGGVLLDPDREKVIQSYNRLGFTEAERLLDIYLQKGVFLMLEKGTADRFALYDYIREKTGKDIPAWKLDDALNDFIVGLAPYKLSLLERLRRDYRLYVLSNTNPVMLPEIDRIWFSQAGKSLYRYFDRLFLSYEMGMLKPDEEIFNKVISDTGVSPAETLFIDDGPNNIEVARRTGLKVRLAKPDEDLRKLFISELGLPPDYFDVPA